MSASHDLAQDSSTCVMLTLTGLCTLFDGLGAVLHSGLPVLARRQDPDWDFFTQLPKPVGETGGGMANAIVGSGKLLLLAALIGVPIGFLGGRVPGGVRRQDVSVRGALHDGPAERRAVDRHRHLRLHADRACR